MMRDDERAALVALQLGGGGPAHLEHDVGVLDRRGGGLGDRRAGRRVFGVGDARAGAGARLDRDLGAERR